ncbi:hypothetical protein V8C40DRAFT_240644 [Trichoderma camerunense]
MASSRMASLRGTVSLQLQPLYTHTLPPECSLPCQKSGLVRRHAEQSALLYEHLRPCSLFALLEFIPGCKQNLYIFFFLSGQLIPAM